MAGKEFFTTVAGVSKKNSDGSDRQSIIKKYARDDQSLILIREPDNPYDKNAISVWIENPDNKRFQIGYMPGHIAVNLAIDIDRGKGVSAKIKEITGGTIDKPTLGINVSIKIDREIDLTDDDLVDDEEETYDDQDTYEFEPQFKPDKKAESKKPIATKSLLVEKSKSKLTPKRIVIFAVAAIVLCFACYAISTIGS